MPLKYYDYGDMIPTIWGAKPCKLNHQLNFDVARGCRENPSATSDTRRAESKERYLNICWMICW